MVRSALVIASLLAGCAAAPHPRDVAPRPHEHDRASPSTIARPASAPAASAPPAPAATSVAVPVASVAPPSPPPPEPPPAEPSPSTPPGPVERAVLRAVESNPTVRLLCADSERRGGPCIVHLDDPGVGACPPRLAALHPCLWTVAVMANMGTHASRRATMLVRPDGVVVAAANLFCSPMRPGDWAQIERASLAGASVDDCPPAVPDAPGLVGTSR